LEKARVVVDCAREEEKGCGPTQKRKGGNQLPKDLQQ